MTLSSFLDNVYTDSADVLRHGTRPQTSDSANPTQIIGLAINGGQNAGKHLVSHHSELRITLAIKKEKAVVQLCILMQ